jgi:hypothetical protein
MARTKKHCYYYQTITQDTSSTLINVYVENEDVYFQASVTPDLDYSHV